MTPTGLELALKGAVIGATFGTPLRRSPKYRKVFDYEPVPTRMAPHPALDFWIVLSDWLQWDSSAPWPTYKGQHWAYRSPEAAFGERNAALGMMAPMAGAWANPYSHYSGAMLRAALYGCAPNGARLAFLDAATDHAGPGVECALAAAGLVSLVWAGVTASAAIAQVGPLLSDAGVAELCTGANFEVLKVEEFAETAALRCRTRNPDDSRLNFLLLCAALRYSGGDLGSCLRTLGSWGGACDVTCGLAGLILGPSQPAVVAEWMQPLATSYVAGSGLRVDKVPETIADFVDRVGSSVRQSSPLPLPGEGASASPALARGWIRGSLSDQEAGGGDSQDQTLSRFASSPTSPKGEVSTMNSSPQEGEVARDEAEGVGLCEEQSSLQPPHPSPLPLGSGEEVAISSPAFSQGSEGARATEETEGVAPSPESPTAEVSRDFEGASSDREAVADSNLGLSEATPQDAGALASDSGGVAENTFSPTLSQGEREQRAPNQSPPPRGGGGEERAGGGVPSNMQPRPLSSQDSDFPLPKEGDFDPYAFLTSAKTLLQIPALSQQVGPMTFAVLSDFKGLEHTVEAIIRYANPTSEKVELKPLLSQPETWTMATRIPDTLLPPGEAWSQALILKPNPGAKSELLKVEWQGSALPLPLAKPQVWYTCGPFPNIEMEAFNRECPCEKSLTTKEQFMGRSQVLVRWEENYSRGTVFEVEPWFAGGQGAYCMAARLRFEPGQSLTLCWHYSPGGQIVLNNQVLLRNNDQTEPIEPLRASFTTSNQEALVIRLMRHSAPASRFVLYFLDERGRLVEPDFLPLDP